MDSHIPPIPTPVNNMKPSSANDNDNVPPFVSQKTTVAKHNNNNNNNNASYHTILVTATLTTLHSKLISDCDHLLEKTMLPPSSNSESHRIFPENALINIANDLRKMSDMVTWESSTDHADDNNNPVSQQSVTQFFQALNDKISQGTLSVSSTHKARKGEKQQHDNHQIVVKEIVSE